MFAIFTLMIILASTVEEGDKELLQQKREVIQAVASFEKAHFPRTAATINFEKLTEVE